MSLARIALDPLASASSPCWLVAAVGYRCHIDGCLDVSRFAAGQSIAKRIVEAIAPGAEFFPPPAFSAFRQMQEDEDGI